MKVIDPMERPLILITNDDGIEAAGILSLAASMDGLGEIIVVAPLHEQSAVGHAITMRETLLGRDLGHSAGLLGKLQPTPLPGLLRTA